MIETDRVSTAAVPAGADDDSVAASPAVASVAPLAAVSVGVAAAAPPPIAAMKRRRPRGCVGMLLLDVFKVLAVLWGVWITQSLPDDDLHR